MATRDLIRDIVETGQAGIVDPTCKAEADEAVTTATIVACYALGELLDDLLQRVERLEILSIVPADLGPQLAGIREELLTLEKAVTRSVRKKKKGKGKGKRRGE